MNDTVRGEMVIEAHCNALARLGSLIMRSATGGTGTEGLSACLNESKESLDNLILAIENNEINDFDLCQKVSKNLEARMFETDNLNPSHLYNSGVFYGVKLAAYRLGGQGNAHLSRAELGLERFARNFDNEYKSFRERIR